MRGSGSHRSATRIRPLLRRSCEVENWQALLSSDRRMAVASWLLEHPTSSQSIRRLSKRLATSRINEINILATGFLNGARAAIVSVSSLASGIALYEGLYSARDEASLAGEVIES